MRAQVNHDRPLEILGADRQENIMSACLSPYCPANPCRSPSTIDLQWSVANPCRSPSTIDLQWSVANPCRSPSTIDLQWSVANPCRSPSTIDLQWSVANPCRSPSTIDLQWFAAEDEGRTEEPSEYKIKKAREEGRVAKSQELVGAVGLLLPALVIVFFASYYADTLREMVVFFLSLGAKVDIVADGGQLASAFFNYFIRLTAPIAIVAMVAAIFSNLLQVGFLFSVKPITPDFSKIVPRFGKYLKRTLFSIEGLFNLAKSIVKVAIIGFVSYLVIAGELDRLRTLYETPFLSAVSYVFSLAMRLIIIVAIALLGLSIPDLLFQKRQYTESLKMSKEEVKEERKQQEGDPLVKSRLRERMRELLMRNMVANVPKADVVITNPTHYAVALEWDRDKMIAPTVTAKGVDEVAQRIKRIAIENDVPLVENRPLARALYADVDIGDVIPEKYYQAIAAVLAHVYGASGYDMNEEAAENYG